MAGLSRELIIVNELGLHARSAARVARIAQTARSNVWIVKDGETVDATSVIDMLSLAGTKGSKIVLTIDDDADAPVMEEIIRLFEKGFGE